MGCERKCSPRGGCGEVTQLRRNALGLQLRATVNPCANARRPLGPHAHLSLYIPKGGPLSPNEHTLLNTLWHVVTGDFVPGHVPAASSHK